MNPNSKSIDVLGLGCTAVDDVLYVASYPAADTKMPVDRSLRRCGGLTAAALVAASRLGARCAYAGRLGLDALSDFVAAHLVREGVQVRQAARTPESGVVHSVIVVGRDTGSRNIFFEAGGQVGAHESLPAPELILSSRVLFIDHWGMTGNLRAARVARAGGVPIVADFEDASAPEFSEVLSLVDHLVLSRSFALEIARASSPAAAALALWGPHRAAVVVTCGDQGCWSVSAERPGVPRHHAAFAVSAADTTGCGDVFHGAYAASLARGEALDSRIRVASAAAAWHAAQTSAPDRRALAQFLLEHPAAEGVA